MAKLFQPADERGHPDVVVVRSDGAGSAGMKMCKPGRRVFLESVRGLAAGGHLIKAISGHIGPGVGAGRQHAERITCAGMRIAYLSLQPPPGGSDPLRYREVCCAVADEWINPFYGSFHVSAQGCLAFHLIVSMFLAHCFKCDNVKSCI